MANILLIETGKKKCQTGDGYLRSAPVVYLWDGKNKQQVKSCSIMVLWRLIRPC